MSLAQFLKRVMQSLRVTGFMVHGTDHRAMKLAVVAKLSFLLAKDPR